MEFILPSGFKVDVDGVIDAMADFKDNIRYFLNSLDGQVGCIDKADKKSLKSMSINHSYIEIPRITKEIRLRSARDFMELILATGDEDDIELYVRLMKILGEKKPNVAEKVMDLLDASDHDGTIGWRQWIGDSLFEEMKKWFAILPIDIGEKFQGICDCELCKLIEKGDHTVGDFNEALQKQEKKSATLK